MAVIITSIAQDVPGTHHEHIVTITGPSSYTITTGEVMTAAQIQQLMPKIINPVIADLIFFVSEDYNESAGLFEPKLRRATGAIRFWDENSEVADTTDISGVVARVTIKYGYIDV